MYSLTRLYILQFIFTNLKTCKTLLLGGVCRKIFFFFYLQNSKFLHVTAQAIAVQHFVQFNTYGKLISCSSRAVRMYFW